MLHLVTMILLLMAFTGCSQKVECPNVVYPELDAIDRIPKYEITVNSGILDQNNTKKAFSLIKALRISENYYYTLISDYREDFNK